MKGNQANDKDNKYDGYTTTKPREHGSTNQHKGPRPLKPSTKPVSHESGRGHASHSAHSPHPSRGGRTESFRKRPAFRAVPPVVQHTAPKHTAGEEPLRFIALGGFGEIGRNMMMMEYRDEIIIIDAGLGFPEENTPGVDYIIPNITYLETNRNKIKALVITHAHYDHIGAIPHIMEKIGNPPIYTTLLSKEIILKRQEDFPNAPKPRFQLVKGGETHQFGRYFSATFFDVVHNIPDGIGIIFRTPIGNVVHPGEFKFDYDTEGKPLGIETWKRVGEEGIHTLLLDSTNAEVPGLSMSERVVEAELEKVFTAAPGRILVGTFASLLDRLGEIIKIAEKLGRKVAISGLSMKTNLQIAQNLGYLKFKKDTFIPLEEIHKHKDDKLMLSARARKANQTEALCVSQMANTSTSSCDLATASYFLGRNPRQRAWRRPCVIISRDKERSCITTKCLAFTRRATLHKESCAP